MPNPPPETAPDELSSEHFRITTPLIVIGSIFLAEVVAMILILTATASLSIHDLDRCDGHDHPHLSVFIFSLFDL